MGRLGQTLRPEACSQTIRLNGCLLLWALCVSWLFLALDINQSILFFLDKDPSFLNWTAWLGFLISLLSEKKCKLLNKALQASSNSGIPQRRQDADGSTVTRKLIRSFSPSHCLGFLAWLCGTTGACLFHLCKAGEFVKWNHLCHTASCCAAHTVKEPAASDGKNVWNTHNMKKLFPYLTAHCLPVLCKVLQI